MSIMNVYLNFAGNAEEAFTFYKSVFGGDFSSLVRYKDMPIEGMDIPDSDNDKIIHIGLPIGEHQTLMGSDYLESLEQKTIFGNNISISIHPDSKEMADQLFAGLSKGGKVEMPMADQVWGDYFGSFVDKYGVMWMLMYSNE